ncbi:MAG: hypothetical protein L6R39_002589 [Caloplaca ligustica]|nr:MAG: hypothetical protein L6R39_002589 [Caloplaca ligustica]
MKFDDMLKTRCDMLLPIFLVAFAGLGNTLSILPRQNMTAVPSAMTGVATFVDFPHQQNTVCGPVSGANGAFGAAAGSISPGLGPGGTCQGTIDMSVCDGQVPISAYVPPSCETNRCGQCYQVTNQGGRGGDASGVGQSIVVQIIDACPATNAWNFCKTDVPDLAQKCMDPGTNSLDIALEAYTGLTGQSYASVKPATGLVS